MADKASRTSSSLKGLMMAVISFIGSPRVKGLRSLKARRSKKRSAGIP
jgi:hypothetical protein